MESTAVSSVYGSQYSESVNSLWTSPNPLILQIGNHLFHKDKVPRRLRYNDQKRDKEALDNIRNRALRTIVGDYTPSYANQAVPPPPSGAYVPYGALPNKTADTVAYSYATRYTPSTAVPASTVTNQGPTLTSAPILQNAVGKPFSPLALPYVPSGNSATNYSYNYGSYGLYGGVGGTQVGGGLYGGGLYGGGISGPGVAGGYGLPGAYGGYGLAGAYGGCGLAGGYGGYGLAGGYGYPTVVAAAPAAPAAAPPASTPSS